MRIERGNLLLQHLPDQYSAAIVSLATPVMLPAGLVLYEPYSTPTFVHFLTSGLAKLAVVMENGEGVECGLMGCEGCPESLHLLGSGPVPVRSVILTSAGALRLDYRLFQNLFETHTAILRMILQYSQMQASTNCLIANCNASHHVEQRLARLLLLMADRIPGEAMLITQGCLARMIGARRTTVSVAAGGLQDAGLIKYVRGKVSILDRIQLEGIACGCYREANYLLRSI